VHVGMAGEKACYAVERRGHRGCYNMRDVDGVVLGDESKKTGGGGWVWKGCPEELVTDLDIEDVWRRWDCALPVSWAFVLLLNAYVQCHKWH
jgi:pyroglutamyl-peptidase